MGQRKLEWLKMEIYLVGPTVGDQTDTKITENCHASAAFHCAPPIINPLVGMIEFEGHQGN